MENEKECGICGWEIHNNDDVIENFPVRGFGRFCIDCNKIICRHCWGNLSSICNCDNDKNPQWCLETDICSQAMRIPIIDEIETMWNNYNTKNENSDSNTDGNSNSNSNSIDNINNTNSNIKLIACSFNKCFDVCNNNKIYCEKCLNTRRDPEELRYIRHNDTHGILRGIVFKLTMKHIVPLIQFEDISMDYFVEYVQPLLITYQLMEINDILNIHTKWQMKYGKIKSLNKNNSKRQKKIRNFGFEQHILDWYGNDKYRLDSVRFRQIYVVNKSDKIKYSDDHDSNDDNKNDSNDDSNDDDNRNSVKRYKPQLHWFAKFDAIRGNLKTQIYPTSTFTWDLRHVTCLKNFAGGRQNGCQIEFVIGERVKARHWHFHAKENVNDNNKNPWFNVTIVNKENLLVQVRMSPRNLKKSKLPDTCGSEWWLFQEDETMIKKK